MQQNKKVRNATKVEIDGIKFRSKLEAYTYKKLKEANLEAEYEPHTYTLLPAFNFHDKKVRPITYLPDFVGDNFIIECKGFPNDAFPIKEKLFKYLLIETCPWMNYYIVHTQKEVDALVNALKQTKN